MQGIVVYYKESTQISEDEWKVENKMKTFKNSDYIHKITDFLKKGKVEFAKINIIELN